MSSATMTADAPVATVHPLKNRPFVLWWLGATTSLLGDQFYLVALPWIVLQITGSAIAMGTVAMCAGIPRAALMLMGGAVTDRVSPRKVLLITASARAVLVAAIGLLLAVHGLQLWHVYLLATAFGVADAFALPSAGPLLRSLVKPEQLPAANSVWQSSALLASVVGPAPAGVITKALGAAWAFFLDAVSFLFVIAALWVVPDPPRAPSPTRPSVWGSIREGIAYVMSDVPLRSLMLLAAAMNFCLSGPLSVGLAYIAKSRFSSPTAFGGWISAVAAGTLVGMLLAGTFKSKRRGVLLVGTGAILGVAMACMGLLAGFWPMALLLFVMGILSGFINVQLQAWLQLRVDRSVLGRVGSVLMLSSFGLMPVSMAAAGVASEWSVTWMFAIGGAAVTLVAVFGAWQRGVREIE
ncbi:MAG TPA: MFS transporter [Candidatus Polarisedimenticolaceae bacterium]|nr:MFS transporter [Candidatus Polarisedimenticolaceae bacterium]